MYSLNYNCLFDFLRFPFVPVDIYLLPSKKVKISPQTSVKFMGLYMIFNCLVISLDFHIEPVMVQSMEKGMTKAIG